MHTALEDLASYLSETLQIYTSFIILNICVPLTHYETGYWKVFKPDLPLEALQVVVRQQSLRMIFLTTSVRLVPRSELSWRV